MVYSLRTRTVAIAVIAGLAVAAFLVFGSGGSGRQARADSAAIAGDTVSVQGTGTVQGVPDRMTATFGVHATRGTVQDALDAVAHDAQRVIAALRHAGVSNADMRTTDLQLYPHYTNRGGRDGYDTSETVTATFHDLGTAGLGRQRRDSQRSVVRSEQRHEAARPSQIGSLRGRQGACAAVRRTVRPLTRARAARHGVSRVVAGRSAVLQRLGRGRGRRWGAGTGAGRPAAGHGRGDRRVAAQLASPKVS